MDVRNVRRVSSAGYRLAERKSGARPLTTPPAAADRTQQRRGRGDAAPAEVNPERGDQVQQDRLWRESVWKERRLVHEWEKNWDFLRNYDQLGQLKPEQPVPSYVPFFSDRLPNTTNQMFGSRLSTPLGSELVRLDRLLLCTGDHHRRKQDPEMLPC